MTKNTPLDVFTIQTTFPRSWVLMVVQCPLCQALIGQIIDRRRLNAKVSAAALEIRLAKRVMALINKPWSVADALSTAVLSHPGAEVLSAFAAYPDLIVTRTER